MSTCKMLQTLSTILLRRTKLCSRIPLALTHTDKSLFKPNTSSRFSHLEPLRIGALQSTIKTTPLRRVASSSSSSSPFAHGGHGGQTTKRKKKKKQFVPRKAAVALTEQSRTFFRKLLENNAQVDGIILKYEQSSTGEPRMVFSFDFVKLEQLQEGDEG